MLSASERCELIAQQEIGTHEFCSTYFPSNFNISCTYIHATHAMISISLYRLRNMVECYIDLWWQGYWLDITQLSAHLSFAYAQSIVKMIIFTRNQLVHLITLMKVQYKIHQQFCVLLKMWDIYCSVFLLLLPTRTDTSKLPQLRYTNICNLYVKWAHNFILRSFSNHFICIIYFDWKFACHLFVGCMQNEIMIDWLIRLKGFQRHKVLWHSKYRIHCVTQFGHSLPFIFRMYILYALNKSI